MNIKFGVVFVSSVIEKVKMLRYTFNKDRKIVPWRF